MKEYIAFETRLFLKNRRNQFLFLGVALYLLGLLFYIPYQNIGDIEDKIEAEAENIRNAIAYVPMHEVEAGTYMEEYAYYDHLLNESRAVASQEVALTMFDDLNQYVQVGLEVTEARIEGHEQGYGSLPNEFIVPLAQSLREQQVYRYLQDNQLQISVNTENAANASVWSVTWFSSVVFFFCLFISCDVLTEDKAHETVVSAYPVHASQKLTAKLIVQTVLTAGGLLALFAGAYVFYSIAFGIGTMQYPVPLYLRGDYTAAPSSIFLITSFVMFIVLISHMVLFSAVLNYLFKNMYLNIFIASLLYILGHLLSHRLAFLRFTPLSYFDPVAVLSGQQAVRIGQESIDLYHAVIVLIGWSVFYGVLLSMLFSRRNRVKSELPARGMNE